MKDTDRTRSSMSLKETEETWHKWHDLILGWTLDQ